MTLQETVTHLGHRVRLIERALSGPGCWAMQCNEIVAPAEIIVSEDGVEFRATFKGIEDGSASLQLLLDGESVWYMEAPYISNGLPWQPSIVMRLGHLLAA